MSCSKSSSSEENDAVNPGESGNIRYKPIGIIIIIIIVCYIIGMLFTLSQAILAHNRVGSKII